MRSLKGLDRADAAERRHRPPQLVGLGRREAGEDRDLHRLFLKQRHAQRLAEHRFQFGGGKRHRLQPLPPAQIGMHHVALDRPRPHDGDLDDEIVELRPASAAAASTSAPGSRSGTRRWCRRAGSSRRRKPPPAAASRAAASARNAFRANGNPWPARSACRAPARRSSAGRARRDRPCPTRWWCGRPSPCSSPARPRRAGRG